MLNIAEAKIQAREIIAKGQIADKARLFQLTELLRTNSSNDSEAAALYKQLISIKDKGFVLRKGIIGDSGKR